MADALEDYKIVDDIQYILLANKEHYPTLKVLRSVKLRGTGVHSTGLSLAMALISPRISHDTQHKKGAPKRPFVEIKAVLDHSRPTSFHKPPSTTEMVMSLAP